jgi:hypothetical protein
VSVALASIAPESRSHCRFSARSSGGQSGKQIMHRQERGLLLDEAVNGEVAGGEFEAHVALPLFRQ